MERVQSRIDELPSVSRTVSFLGTLRSLNRATEEGDPSAERIPDTRAGVAELLFMIPKGTLQRFANVDHSRANVIVRTGAVGSAAMREVVSGIWAVIENSDLSEHFSVYLTGNAILLNRAADGVARAQPRTVGLAALAIFVLLAASMRSLRLGLVAMVPNVVPIALFYGLLGLGAAPLSLPTSLIGSVALGIAIDATAHYLARYRDARQSGFGPEEAVLRCAEDVGRPILIGALMLALGFATICLSEFATLREFGMLASFTMVVCALTDLVLLPAILVRLRI